MTINFDVNPKVGKYPLDASASGIFLSSLSHWYIDNLASAGFLMQSIGMASIGFLGDDSNNTIKWDFGDGTRSDQVFPPVHRYSNPGTYLYTGNEVSKANTSNIIDTLSYLIKVLDDVLTTLNIGGNKEGRRSLTYGNDNEQGFGWSDNGDDGNLWPETKGSIISIFDDNGDATEIVYDSLSGLPYVDNPRKSYGGSRILDAWKDRIDPLLADSGVPIRTRVRLQEFIGSHESFEQKMSDISLFFSPIYKENQGEQGYNADGILSDMKTAIELYKNDLLDEQAHAIDIPMKTELYFDRAIVGNILQLAFETTESEYRFTRGECQLTNYDKARSPFRSRTGENSEPYRGMTEKDFQQQLSDVESLWISRDDTILNRVGGALIAGLEVFVGIGPDGKDDSAFTSATGVVLPNTSTKSLIVISNIEDNTLVFANLDTVLVGEISTGWFVHYVNDDNVVANIETIAGNKYFDLRLLSNNTTEELRTYYINDIVQNSANNVCPRF